MILNGNFLNFEASTKEVDLIVENSIKAGANGAKIIWAGTNADESSVFVMMDVPDPEFMQTFGLRPDIKKAREDAGADVSSTTVITPISDYWLG